MSTQNMMSRKLRAWREHLLSEEKSVVTVEKYLRDVKAFMLFSKDKNISKETAVGYKNFLEQKGYKPRSINSMIAALNNFFEFSGMCNCKLKNVRIQKNAYLAEEKELTRDEYKRLLSVAGRKGRLRLVLQTICSTGIRVSELRYFTVEAVRKGEVSVNCKGKTRTILIPRELGRLLLAYVNSCGISSGTIFITRGGKPLDRSYIWAQMKSLCDAAGVSPSKVFPHNLRKLFARIFYAVEKDIAKLADVLGHSSIETTRIYIMTSGSEHRRQIEKMGLVFAGASFG